MTNDKDVIYYTFLIILFLLNKSTWNICHKHATFHTQNLLREVYLYLLIQCKMKSFCQKNCQERNRSTNLSNTNAQYVPNLYL